MPPSQKPYHHLHLREELVGAACDIISRQGADALTMRELSKMLGVSRTAAYRHFADKTDLLFAVAESGFRQIAAHYGRMASRTEASPLEVLESLGRGYLEFARANPGMYRLMFGSTLIPSKRPDSLRQAADEAFGHLLKTVERCQKQGLVRAGSSLAPTSLLWSAMHGLSCLLIDGQLRTDDDQDGRPVFLTDMQSDMSAGADKVMDLMVKVLFKGLAPD